MENLVIVESPAKAKTIEKFLGKDFKVKSSFGHIRDLAKKGLGINLDKDFEPIYEIPEDKRKVVDELSRMAREAKTVWLASDEDPRERLLHGTLRKSWSCPSTALSESCSTRSRSVLSLTLLRTLVPSTSTL